MGSTNDIKAKYPTPTSRAIALLQGIYIRPGGRSGAVKISEREWRLINVLIKKSCQYEPTPQHSCHSLDIIGQLCRIISAVGDAGRRWCEARLNVLNSGRQGYEVEQLLAARTNRKTTKSATLLRADNCFRPRCSPLFLLPVQNGCSNKGVYF